MESEKLKAVGIITASLIAGMTGNGLYGQSNDTPVRRPNILFAISNVCGERLKDIE